MRVLTVNDSVCYGNLIITKKIIIIIKGGYRRAEKSRKVLMMMMKAVKLGWAGPGEGQEQGRNRAGAEPSRVKESRESDTVGYGAAGYGG